MLVYLIALLVVIWYAVVAHRSGGPALVWAPLGLVSYFLTYLAWKNLVQGALPSDDQAVVVFLLVGMLLGLVVAVVVLNLLLRGAVNSRARRDEGDGRPLPVLTPPMLDRRRYLPAVGATVALAVVSVLLQIPDTIHDEFVVGGMFPAGLAGAVGGVLLRRPGRALLFGAGLGLVYAVCYAPGLHFIGKLPLRGGEAVAGALVGLPLLMIIAAAPAGFLGAVLADALRGIEVRTRWLTAEVSP